MTKILKTGIIIKENIVDTNTFICDIFSFYSVVYNTSANQIFNEGDLLNFKKPIPSCETPDTSHVHIIESNEPLVCISELYKDLMLFRPYYAERGIKGSTRHIYVRKTVSEMLLAAALALPEGLKLKVYDAWRPTEVQKSLFDEYLSRLVKEYDGTDFTIEDLRKKALEFVSYPSSDPMTPFVHSTGGAVDLTLADSYGYELDMGTQFDDFSPAAHTISMESSRKKAKSNRRILYNVMTSVGFTNLPSEWWHYDFGDRFWGATIQKESIYAGIYKEPSFC